MPTTDFIDLRDPVLVKELLPDANFPLVLHDLTAEQCERLTHAVFARTRNGIATLIAGRPENNMIAFRLNLPRQPDSFHGEESEWAKSQGIARAAVLPWLFSHDGSVEQGLRKAFQEDIESN